MKNKEIIAIREASNLLGVCQETLRRWEREGKIKTIKTLGKHRRYLMKDIEKLLIPGE